MASDTDIIARLKLNASQFTAEFGKALSDAEAKGKSTGRVLGNSIGNELGNGLRGLTAQIPVVGNSLTALSGPAAIAAGVLGGVALAAVAGVRGFEEYEKAARQLDGVLTATGNKTGYTKQQLQDFAETLETSIAVSAEEILKAEGVLATFGGVAGTTFTRTIQLAADMSAVFGGDLAGNSEKLGTVLQNLAEGDVTGLSKGFKFLGADTLSVIGNLAEMGRTAEAQEALLKALEGRVGHAADKNGEGLSGAMFALRDATGDWLRHLAQNSGLVDSFAAKVRQIANGISDADGGGESSVAAINAKIARQRQRVAGARDKLGDATDASGILADREELARLERKRELLSGMEVLAQASAGAAAAEQKAEHDKADALDRQKKAREDAARQAEQDAKSRAAEAARIDEAYTKQLRQGEGELRIGALRQVGLTNEANRESAILQLHQQFPTLDAARLATLEQQVVAVARQKDEVYGLKEAVESINRDPAPEFDVQATARKDLEKFTEEHAAALKTQQRELTEQQKRDYQDLADFYYNAFSASTGNIWKDFKNLGKRTLANLLAGLTLGKSTQTAMTGGIASGGTGAGGVLGEIGGVAGLIGGAKSALGAFKSISSLGSAASAVSGAVPYIGAAVAAISLVGGLLKKAPKATSTVTTGDGGASAGTAVGSSAVRAAAQELGNALADEINKIAASLDGKVTSGLTIGSIGQRKGKFTYDPTGRGRTKGSGVQTFATQQEAENAALLDALHDGAIDLGGGAAQNALRNAKSVNAALADAQALASIKTRLRAIDDPVGAALDKVTKEFDALQKTLEANGGSAAELADLERLRGIESKKATEAAMSAIISFRDSMLTGSGSPLSLREQEQIAKAKFASFESSILAGKAVDGAAFADAGRALLDVEKQLYGSTADFFTTFDKVRALSDKALTATNVVPISATDQKTADATAETAANTANMTELLAQVRDQLAQLGINGGGTSSFINSPLFARA